MALGIEHTRSGSPFRQQELQRGGSVRTNRFSAQEDARSDSHPISPDSTFVETTDPDTGRVILVQRTDINNDPNAAAPSRAFTSDSDTVELADARANGSIYPVSHLSLPEFNSRNIRWHWPETEWNKSNFKTHVEIPGNSKFPISHIESLYHANGASDVSVFMSIPECGFEDTVVIKLVRIQKNKKAQNATSDFPGELAILHTLQHNHIVAVLGSYRKEISFGIVLFPAAAWDLAKYLRLISDHNEEQRKQVEHGPKETPHKFEPHPFSMHLQGFFACLINAVQHVHKHIVKHKDLKPSNILIDAYHTVMLADFGVSQKYISLELAQTDTDGNNTPEYSPPEKRNVKKYGKRGLESDYFSLGCVFLEMITVLMGEPLGKCWTKLFEDDRATGVHKHKKVEGPLGCYSDAAANITYWIDHLKRQRDTLAIQRPDLQRFSDDIFKAVSVLLDIDPVKRAKVDLFRMWQLFNGLALSQCTHCDQTYTKEPEEVTEVMPHGPDDNDAQTQTVESERHPFDMFSDAGSDASEADSPVKQVAHGDVPNGIEPKDLESVSRPEAQVLVLHPSQHQIRLYWPRRKGQFGVYLEQKLIPGKRVILFNENAQGKDRYEIVMKDDPRLEFDESQYLLRVPRFAGSMKFDEANFSLWKNLTFWQNCMRVFGEISTLYVEGPYPDESIQSLQK